MDICQKGGRGGQGPCQKFLGMFFIIIKDFKFTSVKIQKIPGIWTNVQIQGGGPPPLFGHLTIFLTFFLKKSFPYQTFQAGKVIIVIVSARTGVLQECCRSAARVLQSAAGVLQSAAGVLQNAEKCCRVLQECCRSAAGMLQNAAGMLQSAAGVLQSTTGVLQGKAGQGWAWVMQLFESQPTSQTTSIKINISYLQFLPRGSSSSAPFLRSATKYS